MADESKPRQRVRRLLNFSILFLLSILVGIYSYSYFFLLEPRTIKIGDHISLTDVPEGSGTRRILVFMESDCIYCTQSAGFYHALSDALSQSVDTQLVAVFSMKDLGSSDYMTALGLANVPVFRISFQSVGIVATPMIAIVDAGGIVENVWRGRLTRPQELEVTTALNLASGEWQVNVNDIDRLKQDTNLAIIDIRGREEYSREHYPNAISVPIDELSIRAINEFSAATTIVIYAGGDEDAEEARGILSGLGFRKILFFNRRQ